MLTRRSASGGIAGYWAYERCREDGVADIVIEYLASPMRSPQRSRVAARERASLAAESVSQIVEVKGAPAREAVQAVAAVAIPRRQGEILAIEGRVVSIDACRRHGGGVRIADQRAEEECREDIACPHCD